MITQLYRDGAPHIWVHMLQCEQSLSLSAWPYPTLHRHIPHCISICTCLPACWTPTCYSPRALSLPVHIFTEPCTSTNLTGACCLCHCCRQCVFSMSNHTMMVTCVKWGGEGLIYSASRDTTISVWDAKDGKLVRILRGHGHWVNTLALSSETVLRTGPFDHRGQAPASEEEAKQVRGPAGRGLCWCWCCRRWALSSRLQARASDPRGLVMCGQLAASDTAACVVPE
jgi:hypothetical protein